MSARAVIRLAMVFGAMALTAAAGERLDFQTRILPILTKAGCNTGNCHGAAVGQGDFKLSLLGYDPVQDHRNITRERGGRRLDVESPETSLLLRKATDRIEHDGGRRIKSGSEAYRTLAQWIGAGAAFGPPDLRVTGIEVEPADVLLPAAGLAQLRVTARLSNGTREDVSALALYSTNDDAVAEVKSSGLVTVRDCGTTSIMVRYSGQVVAARVAVPFSSTEVAKDFVPRNFVDEAVIAELRRLHLPPSPLSEDAEFLRRVHLDLIGRLPSAEEARKFLNEPPSDAKRSRLIAALIERVEFVDFWTMKFGDWLLISGKRGGELPTRTYHAWAREQVARNRPLDQMARDLLLAQGELGKSGPANFYALATDPRDLGEHVGSLFLGTQIACARCHAHPADRWTQDDYHAFAACFARVTQQGGMVRIADRGEVEHPKTHKPVAPRPLGSGATGKVDARDPRVPLAEWLVSGDNPMFARNLVNRVWKHLLGRGLVEPVDDLRPTNPPANPALLDALAANFVRHGFDLRWLVREIAESRTYQLTSLATPENRRDERLFSHAFLKPLSAQVLADAVAQVTGVPDEFPGYVPGTRAVQLIGSQTPSPALDVLGRCARERSCETAGRTGGGLAQALHLINGSTINDKLGSAAKALQARGISSGAIIDELYVRALSRPATVAEHATWEPLLATDADAVEDLLWALLNSREFSFNH